MTEKIKDSSAKVISSAKDMSKVLEDGGILIRKVLGEFMMISDGIIEVNASMEDVRERSDEGMKAIGKVAEGMEEVASTSEKMASSSEETSATIEEQTSAVQQLNDTMNSVREYASNTYAEMIENFKGE
ncbi:MAG: Methyl-accepting chemotaxis protein (MCP) signaling domain protein [Candidatus Methanolliviera sp. GoM_oil]|nr:MAG: Methyl-accepting chemotaxis protein (MCP) signaling domain protein [Candidatus Methanolliviera sp. GoM_oil]